MTTHQVFVTINGTDQVGLIATVSACLFDLGANLGDTSYTVLGAGFDFSAVCDMPAGVTLADIRAGLTRLQELQGARITVEPFELEAEQAENAQITHRLRGPARADCAAQRGFSPVRRECGAYDIRPPSVRRKWGLRLYHPFRGKHSGCPGRCLYGCGGQHGPAAFVDSIVGKEIGFTGPGCYWPAACAVSAAFSSAVFVRRASIRPSIPCC